MIKLYLFSKKIHRILVLLIILMTLVMIITGVALKYQINFFDLGLFRFIHNNLSPLFSIILILMILTGSVLYIFPLLKRK
jgi:exosortase/archaeosortase